MSADRIYRYTVPVDDHFHEFTLSGRVLSVGCRRTEEVEFWALSNEDSKRERRAFTVVGTGHPLPEDVKYVGTAVTPGGALVWHLMEAAS